MIIQSFWKFFVCPFVIPITLWGQPYAKFSVEKSDTVMTQQYNYNLFSSIFDSCYVMNVIFDFFGRTIRSQGCLLAISKFRTANHLWIVSRQARKYERCHIISEEKPERLCALFVNKYIWEFWCNTRVLQWWNFASRGPPNHDETDRNSLNFKFQKNYFWPGSPWMLIKSLYKHICRFGTATNFERNIFLSHICDFLTGVESDDSLSSFGI